jgi:hypothetical protein
VFGSACALIQSLCAWHFGFWRPEKGGGGEECESEVSIYSTKMPIRTSSRDNAQRKGLLLLAVRTTVHHHNGCRDGGGRDNRWMNNESGGAGAGAAGGAGVGIDVVNQGCCSALAPHSPHQHTTRWTAVQQRLCSRWLSGNCAAVVRPQRAIKERRGGEYGAYQHFHFKLILNQGGRNIHYDQAKGLFWETIYNRKQ